MHSQTTTKKSTEAKRVSVSYESQQETMIMSLLALYGIKFVVLPPRKSCTSCQFIDIKEVIINGVHYDFEMFVQMYIVSHGKTLAQDTPHFNKYQKRNQTAATNNILTDMLKELGWKISFKNSKEATITLKMERINVLSYNGIVINGDDIAAYGEQLNKQLKSVVSQKRDVSLVIGQAELPIELFTDVSAAARSFDLVVLEKMLMPVNVSMKIGEVVPEEITTPTTGNKGVNGYYIYNQGNEYENEERRNENEKYAVECSKIMEIENQSQQVTQSITGSAAAQWFGMTMSTACCAPAVDGLHAHNELIKREENDKDDKDMRDIRDIEITDIQIKREEKEKEELEKYENELPPSTNVPQCSQVSSVSQESFAPSFNSNSVMNQENVQGWMYMLIDGQYYLVNCILPVPTTYCPQGSYGYQGNETVANASTMVEGAFMSGNEENCGFNNMANYYSAV